MQKFFILFKSIVNPDTGDTVIESVTVTAATRDAAIIRFHELMQDTSLEIITARPFVEPVL